MVERGAGRADGVLELASGFATASGKRKQNEDFAACFAPRGACGRSHGSVAAIADGVGGAKGGRVAAELSVRGFVEGYYGLPAALPVAERARASLLAINRWIYAQGTSDPALEGMASTFTALILLERRLYWLHVGDTRLYRLRHGRLTCLTTDHTVGRAGLSHVLMRAVGLEAACRPDDGTDILLDEDRYLLCTDGVHRTLSVEALRTALTAGLNPRGIAADLVEAALAAGSTDNATALVIEVLRVPTDRAALDAAFSALPMGDPPEPGQSIDGFLLEARLGTALGGQRFRARDPRDGSIVCLEFPDGTTQERAAWRDGLLTEIWATGRVRNNTLDRPLDTVPAERRTRLYRVGSLAAFQPLAERLSARPLLSMRQRLELAAALAEAVAALHHAGIAHGGIAADRVHVEAGNGLRLHGLAAARTLDDGGEARDVAALGLLLHRLFGGAQPPDPDSPQEALADYVESAGGRLPAWLDAALRRAILPAPGDKAVAADLLLELRWGSARVSPAPASFYQGHRLRIWQAAAAVCAILAGILAFR